MMVTPFKNTFPPQKIHYFVLLFLAMLFMLSSCDSQTSETPTINSGRSLDNPKQIFPSFGALTGAYIDFGDYEDTVTLEAIERFETMVGKHQAIIASSNFWGEQKFPRKTVAMLCRRGVIPLLFWSPWDRPYVEKRPPDRFSLDSILAGKWDNYIDQWADQAKAINKPIMVSWGLEMNGEWFPWSGIHYGGGKPIGTTEQSGYAGPELYKRAFRYVVSRVKSRGADKILWVFHANNLSFPPAPWNGISQYYPGSDVVDILALSVYGKLFYNVPWVSFEKAMDKGYKELCLLDAEKPVMVAEWAVGEFPKSGNKATWIEEAFVALKNRYPRVKAAVYWHERWENKDETYTNLRINSTPEALKAYRNAIADPYWSGGR